MSGCLVFDCDGVLADTEFHGHLPAFNRMWSEVGVPWRWSAEEYGRMLLIGGGKERLARLLDTAEFQTVFPVPADADERAALVAAWHARKSALFQRMIEEGSVPPRPGIKRLVEEALRAGWRLGVASTSARTSVEAVLRVVVGGENAARFDFVLGGEAVERKKPAPDVYLRAAALFGVPPDRCVAIEDSGIGLRAAKGAGMVCVVTPSVHTVNEDFAAADLVVSTLGDPDGERCRVLAARGPAPTGPHVELADLAALLQPSATA